MMQNGSEYVISEGFTDSVTEDDLKHNITQYNISTVTTCGCQQYILEEV